MADEYAMTWGSEPSSNDKLLSVAAWLIPVIFGPLLILLMFQDKSKYIKYHATQSLLFQGVVWVLAVVVVPVISVFTCGLGGLLYLPLMAAYLGNLYGAYLSWTGQWTGLPGLANYGR